VWQPAGVSRRLLHLPQLRVYQVLMKGGDEDGKKKNFSCEIKSWQKGIQAPAKKGSNKANR